MTIENSFVVLKFQYGRRGSTNPVISNTMGRVAVLNFLYQGTTPQPKSFWLCRVDREASLHDGRGYYVVTPVREVQLSDIVKLIPGTYDAIPHGSTMILKPKITGHLFLAPFSIKRKFIKQEYADHLYNSLIVPLEEVE